MKNNKSLKKSKKSRITQVNNQTLCTIQIWKRIVCINIQVGCLNRNQQVSVSSKRSRDYDLRLILKHVSRCGRFKTYVLSIFDLKQIQTFAVSRHIPATTSFCCKVNLVLWPLCNPFLTNVEDNVKVKWNGRNLPHVICVWSNF
jgi:hypothetical protein